MIQSVRPIKRCPSRTQTKLAICQRADPVTTEAKLTAGRRYFHRRFTEGFPKPLLDVAPVVEPDAFTK